MGEPQILPSGKSVTLRRPDDVSERLRRPISRALRTIRAEVMEASRAAAEGMQAAKTDKEKQAAQRVAAEVANQMTEGEVDAFSQANDLAIVALVASWTHDAAITLDSVLDLPHRDYDRLREIVAPLVNELFLDVSPDPKNPPAPTGGSNGSATPSTAALQIASPTSGGYTA